MADISLTAGIRTSLLSLKGTATMIDKTQERLSSGKKVNSALDNPTNFFAAQAHLNRAGDLDSRKDGIMEAIKNGEAANIGLKSIMEMIQAAKGLASAAHTAGASERVSLATQFNEILDQIDTLAGDSSYRGTNLLKGNDLTVNFNENGGSNLTISGVNATSGALGISKTASTGKLSAASSQGSFALALDETGSVFAWGDNSDGQTNIPTAAQSGVVAISAGYYHALALKDDGSVVAWGANDAGKATVPVAAQSGVVAVAAGYHFSLALKDDGSVIGWGDNDHGQINIPVAAQSGVVAIAAGPDGGTGDYSLALKDDGSVVAWGDNTYGQTAVPLTAQSGVVAIAAGRDYSLALKSDGSVVAWGDNTHGQTTVPAAAQSGVVAIVASGYYALALKDDGSVVAWGSNGGGTTTVPAAAQSGVVAIAAGDVSFALKEDGSVVTWGDDYLHFGLKNVPQAWATDAGITTSESQLETAMTTLRTNAVSLSSNLSVIAVRKDFTQQMINKLQEGADNLTLADMNEEGASMLMLQTRQSLGITSLSLGSQAVQGVIKLFS